jgi:hypothetical protein
MTERRDFFKDLNAGLSRADRLVGGALAYSLAQVSVGCSHLASASLERSKQVAENAPVESSLAAALGHSMVHASGAATKAATFIEEYTTPRAAGAEAAAKDEAAEAGAHPS